MKFKKLWEIVGILREKHSFLEHLAKNFNSEDYRSEFAVIYRFT